MQTKTAYTPNGSEGKTSYTGSQPYKVNTAAVTIDGQTASLDSFVISDSTGGGHTYFKLRDLGKALNFYVGWSKDQGISIDTGKPYAET